VTGGLLAAVRGHQRAGRRSCGCSSRERASGQRHDGADGSCDGGTFFILTLYQQQVLGYSAIQSGLSQVPLAVVLIALAGAAGPLVARFGLKPALTVGLTVFARGIAWLAQITTHRGYLATVLGPSLLMGAGLALAFVALTDASARGVDERAHHTAPTSCKEKRRLELLPGRLPLVLGRVRAIRWRVAVASGPVRSRLGVGRTERALAPR
jgi:hypothetical protein